MSMMDTLWQYYEAAQKVDQLDARVKSTPQRTQLNKLHVFLSEQQGLISTTQKQIESRQKAVKRLDTQFDEIRRQYELEASEFHIMENDEQCTAAEMAECRKALSALLDQVTASRKDLFDTINWIEQATAQYKDIYAKAGKAKREYDTVRAECEKELAQAQPEIEAAKVEAERLRAKVDETLLKRYDIVKTHHAVPMAKVANNQCGGCNMSLPTSVVKRVNSGTDIVECENCGRILYA